MSANQSEFVHTFVPPLEEDKTFAAILEDTGKTWNMSRFDVRDGLLRSIAYYGAKGRAQEFIDASDRLGASLGREVIVTAISPKRSSATNA